MGALVAVSSFVAFALLAWFKTNTIPEYRWLLKWVPFLFSEELFNEYDRAKREDATLTYSEFITNRLAGTFWGKVLACPICLGTWLSILPSLGFEWGLFMVPGLSITAFMLYFAVIALSKAAGEDL